ncbi:Uncharacterized protein Fot_56006 [Forsythia ovata]|uniref:Uncharacterized protein n=1 Tax=Forsythia ovata TaxID=205694 RepID=A0ABD1P2R7_9LAMI
MVLRKHDWHLQKLLQCFFFCMLILSLSRCFHPTVQVSQNLSVSPTWIFHDLKKFHRESNILEHFEFHNQLARRWDLKREWKYIGIVWISIGSKFWRHTHVKSRAELGLD